MSLEDKIEKLTLAMGVLTEALTMKPVLDMESPPPKKRASRAKKTTATTPPALTETAPLTTPPMQCEADPVKKLSQDDVRDKAFDLVKVVTPTGKDAKAEVQKILQKYGAGKVAELDEKHYDNFVKEVAMEILKYEA